MKGVPVACDGLDGAVVSPEGDVEPDDCVASLDEFEVLFRDACLGGGSVEEELNLLQESRLLVLIELGTELLASVGRRKGFQLYNIC